jgi:hypothetical protein
MVGEQGAKRGHMHPLKVFLSGVSAGCLLMFAPASAATMTTSTWVSCFPSPRVSTHAQSRNTDHVLSCENSSLRTHPAHNEFSAP